MSNRHIPLLAAFALFAAGCDTMVKPESVLEGQWELVKASADPDSSFLITLDDEGRVTETATVNGNVTITNRDATGSATLNGFNVTLRTGSVKFEGTFNDNFTEAEGKQFSENDIPFIGLVTVDEGEATLRRIN